MLLRSFQSKEKDVLLSKKLVFIILINLFAVVNAYSQIRLVVNQIPKYTPENSEIYITGSFNNWDPSSPAYKLAYDTDSSYYFLELSDSLKAFEFKFTRGINWDRVEASSDGYHIQNRVFIAYREVKDTTIYCQISSWKDLAAETTFEIKSLPENTPANATIYISGSFNDWTSPDSRYQLEYKNNTYSITLPSVYDTFSYKFTRGDWATVEGGPNGGFRPNRTYMKSSETREVVQVNILSWEDLSENVYTFSSFVLLLSAVLNLIMVFIISSIDQKNRQFLRPLFVLLLLYSFGVICRVIFDSKEIFALQPKLYLVPELVIFLFGPFYLYFTKALLKRSIDPEPTLNRWLFIPFIVQLLVYIPWLILTDLEFTRNVINQVVINTVSILGGFALLFNMGICWVCFRKIQQVSKLDKETIPGYKISFLNSLQIIYALGLLVWAMTFVIGIFKFYPIIEFEVYFYVDFGIKMTWFVFGLSAYVVTYFSVKYPELLRMNPTKIEKTVKAQPSDQQIYLQKKLEKVMQENKAYLNAQLNVQELAETLGTNSHTLSRLINESYGQNFNEYVNTYRVKEFIRVVLLNTQRENFSTLALEVGFNSKPTFNRAFKKVTGMTPKEYFKSKS